MSDISFDDLTAVCKDCKQTKPLKDMCKTTQGIASWCVSCRKAYYAAYYLKNQAKIDARNKAWQENNKERTKVHVTTYREKHKTKKLEQARRWRENNKDYDAFRSKQRKAMKAARVPAWANSFFMQEAYRLARLRSQITGIEWHVDHIVPLKSEIVSGLHWEGNFQLLPASLNHSKGNRWWPGMPNA